jgi:hypothetical protein
MTVSSYIADDKFILRIIKSLAANPDNQWANSYEFVATTPGTEAELLTLIEVAVLFEQQMHGTVVNFVQAIVSTWEEDSVPYNPETFVSSPLSQVGLRSFGSNPVALDQTMSITRVCATGRFGHIFWRGALEEGDVSAPAGKSILTNKVSTQASLDTAISESAFSDYLGSPAAGPFQLVMISKDGSQVRPVIGLIAQGVSSVPNDHAWFNRTTPTP